MGNLRAFIVFVSMVLLIYGGANFYVYRRIMQAAMPTGPYVWVLRSLLLFLIISFPLSHFLSFGALRTVITWIGAFWLAALMYAFLFAIISDLIRLSDLVFGWLPSWVIHDRETTNRTLFYALTVITLTLLTVGHIRSLYPVVKEFMVVTGKLPEDKESYTLAVFADSHIGTIVGKRRVERIIEQVNSLGADAILVVGDLVDEPPARIQWAIEPLSKLEANDGVWAVLGNHEYYSGADASVKFMEQAGMTVLRDQAVTVGEAITLVGLDDITGAKQYERPPMQISYIMGNDIPGLPVVLLHHTPRRIQEASDAGADVMFSGHSHDGQMFPANLVASSVFGVKPGLTKFGNLNFILSAGVGTWGPPVRTSAPPDILLVTLKKTG